MKLPQRQEMPDLLQHALQAQVLGVNHNELDSFPDADALLYQIARLL
ncbi:MAG: hypothetical protein M1598_07705 [Actinobacteria bacterium]|nr:hypothetical protein [Actinomycetota bacterium]